MSLRLAGRFARREMRGGLRGFRLFLACLALGVAAIAAVGSVRSAIEGGLQREGAALLGGAAEIDFTYRFATDAERDWIESQASAVSEVVEFRSMAVAGDGAAADRALTQVKAVDDLYPLVGEMVLEPAMPLEQALGLENGLSGAVMERALSDRLGLSPGDTFKLGVKEFRLSALIVREPDSAASGFALGPRTLLRTEALDGAGLLAEGTLFNSKYRMLLPADTDLDQLRSAARARFENSGMRWTDARNGAPGVSRFVERLTAFLILVGLSGLAVGGVGVSAAVRSYLTGKTEVIAVLRALGADRATIFQTYFMQIGALSLLGVAIGVVLGAVAPLIFAPLISARLPVPAFPAEELPIRDWLLEFYPGLMTLAEGSAARPLECIQREGELLYVPEGWCVVVSIIIIINNDDNDNNNSETTNSKVQSQVPRHGKPGRYGGRGQPAAPPERC